MMQVLQFTGGSVYHCYQFTVSRSLSGEILIHEIIVSYLRHREVYQKRPTVNKAVEIHYDCRLSLPYLKKLKTEEEIFVEGVKL